MYILESDGLVLFTPEELRTLHENPCASGGGVKVEAILKDDEMLTSFLLRDIPLTQSVVNQLVSAQIRLEQVYTAHTHTHTRANSVTSAAIKIATVHILCPLALFFFSLQFAFGVPDLHLKDIACSLNLLERFLIFPSRRGLYAVRNAMCILTPQRLQIIEDKFYANVDFFKLFRLVSVS